MELLEQAPENALGDEDRWHEKTMPIGLLEGVVLKPSLSRTGTESLPGILWRVVERLPEASTRCVGRASEGWLLWRVVVPRLAEAWSYSDLGFMYSLLQTVGQCWKT